MLLVLELSMSCSKIQAIAEFRRRHLQAVSCRKCKLFNPDCYHANDTPAFHPFPRLPTEIQRAIWSEYMASTLAELPRHITLSPKAPLDEPESCIHHFQASYQSVPPILHIHQNARLFALQWASLDVNLPQFRDKLGNPVIFNPEIDILCLSHRYERFFPLDLALDLDPRQSPIGVYRMAIVGDAGYFQSSCHIPESIFRCQCPHHHDNSQQHNVDPDELQ